MSRPCKRGHSSSRYANGSCKECAAMRKGHKGRKMPEPRFTAAVTSARQFAKVVRAETAKIKPRHKRPPMSTTAPTSMPPLPVRGKKAAKAPSLNIVDMAITAALMGTAPPSHPLWPDQTRPQDGEIRTDSTGQRWLYRHRLVDGNLRIERAPVPANPKPAPPPKPAEPERPKTRVELLREKYLQHHVGASPGPGGFDNPGGIVTANMNRETFDYAPWDAWRFHGGPNWTKLL